MKKFIKAIKKNYKILFRIKASLIAMIFGPLLVIFLIGFAFNSSSQFQISIGYSVGDNSTLTTDFVDTLKEEYQVKEFALASDCIWELKQSLQHVCIDFPNDFVLRPDKINNITFYVDETRINIVYAVLASVSKQIGLKTDQLSEGLTQTLIDTLDESSNNIDSNLGNLILIKKSVTGIKSDVDTSITKLNNINFESESVDTNVQSELNSIQSGVVALRNDGRGIVTTLTPVMKSLKSGETNTSKLILIDQIETELEDLNESVTKEYNSTATALTTLSAAIADIQDAVEELETSFSDAGDEVKKVRNDLQASLLDLERLEDDVDSVKQNLEKASQRINQVEITSSEQIVNPITTNIETVASDQNRLLILFPYVLLLIIMFGGLMLSSTLIVLEKKSKASFRVFTTPTRNQFFIWTSFFTGFSIIVAQILFIYVLMRVFFIDLIGSQLLTNSVVLIIASSLFIMMGMAIGYVMKNQQGANMVSISIGAVFLFLSNIVLPLETVAPYLQEIAKYNPFVIASEILRKSIIFQTPLQEMYFDIGLLAGYAAIIFILITIFHNLAKANFVRRLTKKTKRSIKKQGIKVKDTYITNEKELIQFVNSCADKEFKQLVRSNKRFRLFIRDEVSDPIGRRVKRLTKAEFLKAIEEKNKEIIAYLEAKKPLHKQSKKNKNAAKNKEDAK